MADPFVAEIRIFAGNFAPRGWATCDGQLLAIAQNTALFSLLGTTYGGNGQTTFGLPDLGGRAPMQWGQGPGLRDRVQGEVGGEAASTLIESELPAHSHPAAASTTGTPSTSPANRFWGQVPTLDLYRTAPDASLAPDSLAPAGGSQPHNNMQPYLALLFIIAMVGIFPPRQ
jgi:microcystin-dependent protein